MTTQPNGQDRRGDVERAADEWLDSPEAAVFSVRHSAPLPRWQKQAMKAAFMSGVSWMAREFVEARGRAGSQH